MPICMKSKLSFVKHSLRDKFLKQKPENEKFKNMGKNEVAHLVGGAPSINSLSPDILPKKNVFILNHFWLHDHYPKVDHGFHCISDDFFLLHPRILEFPKRINKNCTIVTTDRIKRKLIKLGVSGKIITLNYSASKPVFNKKYALQDDLTEIVQTGATVAADFALPMISYMGFSKVVLLGFDLDYGKDVQRYAYDTNGAIFTNRSYLRNIWPDHARISMQRWIDALVSDGKKVTSLTPTPLNVEES